MEIIPYLYFNGNANEAIAVYQKVFKSADPKIMRYKDQPSPDLSESQKEMILHAELITPGGIFYISDSFGDNTTVIGSNVQINLNCDNEEQIKWIFETLSIDGVVSMPLQDTFWGALFGSLTDKFGISWSMNFQKVPQPEYEQRT